MLQIKKGAENKITSMTVILLISTLKATHAMAIWEYHVSSNGSATFYQCEDPVACAKAALQARWTYPPSYSLIRWKECRSHPTPHYFECKAQVHRLGDEGVGVVSWVCNPGDGIKVGATCLKDENDYNCKTSIDNPVDARLGTKHEFAKDYQSDNGRLFLTRTYSSSFGMYGIKSVQSARFGKVWRSNFDVSITILNAQTEFYVALPNGQERNFALKNGAYVARAYNYGSRGWQDALQVKERLRKVNDRYELITNENTIYSFDSDGNLSFVSYPDGYVQNLVWTLGKNTSIIDSFGQKLEFSYGEHGFVSTVTLPDSSQLKYEYESKTAEAEPILHPEYALSRIIYPDPTAETDTDNPTFRYYYEDIRFRYALTGKTDERGVRTRSWTYNADGRVSTIILPENQGNYTFEYNVSSEFTTVTNPLGKKSVYRYTRNAPGASRLKSIDGVASANCVSDNTIFTYDSRGFVASEIDGEGRKTTYTNDTRGNPISIIRGAP